MGVMKKKLIEKQIEQELELEMVDSKDGEVTFKVVEVDNEREYISYVHVRDEAKVEEAIQKMYEKIDFQLQKQHFWEIAIKVCVHYSIILIELYVNSILNA